MAGKEGFSSRIGFILSCVGAAIGLGNVWMFPYKLGENGGAAFLIPYFFFVLVLGTMGLMGEMAFGRKYEKGSLGAIGDVFKEKNKKGYRVISVIPTVGLMGIFMFYTVVIGWVLKYFISSVTGEIITANTETYFINFAYTPSSLIWQALAVLITVLIVSVGVSNGIEKINKIIIPMLFVIFIMLMCKSISLSGSEAGLVYLLKPQWKYLLIPKTWVMALGQAFFTVSITGAAMVLYGSYAGKDFDIPNCAVNTAIFDTLAALLAGFMIMPAVFAFGLSPTAGPALMFVTIPSIFQTMPLGRVLCAFFFLSIIFASISSSISMLEVPAEALRQVTKWGRKKSTIIVAFTGLILGIPLGLSEVVFDNFTNLITIVISPIGAVITAIVFYYMVDENVILDSLNKGAKFKFGKWFVNFGRYIFVPATIIIIILGVIYGGIG